MIKLLGYAVAAAVVLGLVLCVPFAVIWMINVFGEYLWPGRQLPYAWDTWLAAMLFSVVITPAVRSKR